MIARERDDADGFTVNATAFVESRDDSVAIHVLDPGHNLSLALTDDYT
jgi:hypothetical protein